jgi:hypothetical protein
MAEIGFRCDGGETSENNETKVRAVGRGLAKALAPIKKSHRREKNTSPVL